MEKKYNEIEDIELKISTSQDKMQAFISIRYINPKINGIVVHHCYTTSDIKSELAKARIIFGIIDIVVENIGLSNCKNELIARGKNCVDGIDDKIKINFNAKKSFNNMVEETTGNIDFKSIGSIEAVHRGDVIAVLIKGTEGLDGCNVFGKRIVHKKSRIMKLKASSGCEVRDFDKVVALIDGKPCVKGNTFYVYKLHELKDDVDIKSGNIKFIGDIVVYGGVKEGMTVDCGNCLKIYKDIERAVIKSKNNIEIMGNVITSKVMGGGDDVVTLRCITNLENINLILKNLILVIEEIKKSDLLGKGKKDGEIIKVLIENKFKNLTRLCISAIAFLNVRKESATEEVLVTMLRNKFIGLGPIKIKHYGEIDRVINLIDEKIEYLKCLVSLPVEVKFSYCQDSKIESTGNIILTGKGEYVSEIISNDGVYFMDLKSVTRGGSITAKNLIKCRKVGSPAGVPTILSVERHGEVWIDTAYQNTKILVGSKEYIFEVPCKNIHAFIDSDKELVVERIKL